jgi:hypothetical protein
MYRKLTIMNKVEVELWDKNKKDEVTKKLYNS